MGLGGIGEGHRSQRPFALGSGAWVESASGEIDPSWGSSMSSGQSSTDGCWYLGFLLGISVLRVTVRVGSSLHALDASEMLAAAIKLSICGSSVLPSQLVR